MELEAGSSRDIWNAKRCGCRWDRSDQERRSLRRVEELKCGNDNPVSVGRRVSPGSHVAADVAALQQLSKLQRASATASASYKAEVGRVDGSVSDSWRRRNEARQCLRDDHGRKTRCTRCWPLSMEQPGGCQGDAEYVADESSRSADRYHSPRLEAAKYSQEPLTGPAY